MGVVVLIVRRCGAGVPRGLAEQPTCVSRVSKGAACARGGALRACVLVCGWGVGHFFRSASVGMSEPLVCVATLCSAALGARVRGGMGSVVLWLSGGGGWLVWPFLSKRETFAVHDLIWVVHTTYIYMWRHLVVPILTLSLLVLKACLLLVPCQCPASAPALL